MANTFSISLDVSKPSGVRPVVIMRQADKLGTTIEATFYDHGAAYNPSSPTVAFIMELPDGLHYYRKTATYSSGKATVAVDETEAASVPGVTHNAYFEITTGGNKLSTESFDVVILKSALDGTEMPESFDDTIVAAVDTWLEAHPEATMTVQDGAVTTAKLADGSVTDAKLVQEGGILEKALKFAGNVTASNKSTVLPDLNYVEKGTYYTMFFVVGTTVSGFPLNMPDLSTIGGAFNDCMLLINWGSASDAILQELRNKYCSVFRVLNVATHAVVQDWIVESSNLAVKVNSSNYSSVLPNLNNAKVGVSYLVEFAVNASIPIVNFPISKADNSRILVFSCSTPQEGAATQYIVCGNATYQRKYNPNTGATIDNALVIAEKNNIPGAIYVNASNYQSVLPSINNADLTKTYVCVFDASNSVFIADTPFTFPPATVTIIKHEPILKGNSSFVIQTIEADAAKVSRVLRVSDGAVITNWFFVRSNKQEWFDDSPKIIVAKDITTYRRYALGSVLFSSVLEACLYAYNTRGIQEIHILEGEYDLVEEYENRYGSLENFSDSMTSQMSRFNYGLQLRGVKLIGHGDAVIKFEYEGSNAFINKEFSPIDTPRLYFGAQLAYCCGAENLTIKAKNCRYCIHDEEGSSNPDITSPITHIWRGLNLYLDNSANPNWTPKQVIGGGLGVCENVLVENCIFDSVGADGVAIVSYHNNASPSKKAQNKVVIKDNYFKHGTIRISWYGQSERKSTAIVTNNSVDSAVQFRAETQDTSPYENFELMQWNNEIR